MVDRDPSHEAAVTATLGEIVGRLHERLTEVSARTQAILINELPELRDDRQLVALLSDTVTANIETVFAAMKNGVPLKQIGPPSVTLEYARRLAQRDVPANVLVRAYRIGHQTVLKITITEIRKSQLSSDLALDVTDRLTTDTFEYIDWMSQKVITTYHEERDRWHGSRSYDRAAHVRELLKDGPADVDAMTMVIRYPLQRTHLALVVWCLDSPDGNETALLEQFVQRVSKAISPRDACLYVPSDRLTGWAWIPVPPDTTPSISTRIREVIDRTDNPPFVAVGRALPGLDGFRRSHRQARDVRRVSATIHGRTDHVIEATEPGVLLAGLLGENPASTRLWVSEVLGPLACNDENDERLRDTLRTFLRTGSSFKAAAAELHLHFNTVRYRVDRAVERRGIPIEDDRLDVEVALLLCHLLGDAVLTDS